MKPIFYWAAIALSVSCAKKTSEKRETHKDSVTLQSTVVQQESPVMQFPYDLSHPSDKFKLPDELREISGIDVYKKHKLVCEEDENGKVFIYDAKKGDLKETVKFARHGDYEGIANVNDTIYVLRSDGVLFQVTGFETADQATQEFPTFLNKENNTEGLCFDSANHRLLIACKGDPGNNLSGVRAVYAFDLKRMKLQKNPVYIIHLDELKADLAKVDKSKLINEETRNLLDPEKGDVTFQPSEIAIHPITDEICLISTVGKLMVVMNRAGKILHIESLDPAIFKQPEGLCFLPNGDMYISDEGREGKANILLFKYMPEEKK